MPIEYNSALTFDKVFKETTGFLPEYENKLNYKSKRNREEEKGSNIKSET